MSEENNPRTKRRLVLVAALVGMAVILVCGLCVAVGVVLRDSLAPQGALTRTALVGLFGTAVPQTTQATSELEIPTSTIVKSILTRFTIM